MFDIGKIEAIEKLSDFVEKKQTDQLILVCRRGNDSQMAVKLLEKNLKNNSELVIKDIIGGLQSWSDKIDYTFPKY